jgi:hypothetical protein
MATHMFRRTSPLRGISPQASFQPPPVRVVSRGNGLPMRSIVMTAAWCSLALAFVVALLPSPPARLRNFLRPLAGCLTLFPCAACAVRRSASGYRGERRKNAPTLETLDALHCAVAIEDQDYNICFMNR